MIRIKIFEFNPFHENTYVVFDETNEGIVVDPGCYEKQEEAMLDKYILENSIKVTSVVNTHCHIDHVLGNYYVKQKYNVPLSIPDLEIEGLRAVPTYAPMYGFHRYTPVVPDLYLSSGSLISFGRTKLKCLFVPGHSRGHMAFYHEQQHICIGGDVLFRESIGRTDLPGGDFNTLIESIHQKLFTLPDETVVYPGHGPSTTIAHEKKHNPFCALIEKK